MALRGRPRKGKQVTTSISAIGSAYRAQEFDEMSNPYNTIWKNVEEKILDLCSKIS